MKHKRALLTALVMAQMVTLHAVEPKLKPKPEFQYKSAGIEVPVATVDEPRVKAFGVETIKAAVKYLADGAHHWVREKSCIACHSTGVYMVQRSALTALLGKPSEEVLRDFIDKVLKEGRKPHASPIKSVLRSSGLASWDKRVAGKLSEHTDRSLRHTLTLLSDDGSSHTIKQVEIPCITTHFELTVQAARAVATAPGWLANLKDADTLARVERMKKFRRQHVPPNDCELALKLQISVLMPEPVPPTVRDAATAMLWRFTQLSEGRQELYDHDNDAVENLDVAKPNPAVVEELSARLKNRPAYRQTQP